MRESIATSNTRIPVSAVVAFVLYTVLLPAVIFLAAGTIQWPMGWIYWGVTVIASLLSRAWAAMLHPEVLAERVRSQGAQDVKPWDRLLSRLVGLFAPFVNLVVVGLDRRWAWSPSLPAWIAWAALGLLVLSYAFGTWAFLTNRFFSAVVRIQRERGHHAVTDGPYRIVRHPGYLGGIVAAFATPLLLGSLWGLISAAIYAAIIGVRTALEDRTLHEELPGYVAYAQRTRYRLIPGVW